MNYNTYIGQKYYHPLSKRQVEITQVKEWCKISQSNINYSGYEAEFEDNDVIVIYKIETCSGIEYEGTYFCNFMDDFILLKDQTKPLKMVH